MEGDAAVNKDLESDYQQAATKQSSNTASDTVKSELETDLPIADKSKVINQRSSNRLTKRTRKDQPSQIVSKKAVIAKQEVPSTRSKTRRPWELWSVEDKNAFFEALCEYGKDFENIQSYIAQRSKKKGVAVNMIKNKDQVRHFYYRTWHKISKFLEISESIQKQAQELYGLINYGELRKKVGGCLNEKNRIKLNELVFSGVTTVKYKGKKVRIKTPVCRALKKLNNFADAKEPEAEKLPKEIIVEFRPRTNAAWLHVQDLAQNPRVRTKVCLQRRLKAAVDYLQKRWKPYRLKKKEQILNSLPNCNSEELVCDTSPIIRVKPPRDAKIFPVSFSVIDTASSSDVCLEKYITLSQKSLCKDVNKSKKSANSKPKSLSDKTVENSQTAAEKLNNVTENNLQLLAEKTNNTDSFCEITADRANNISNKLEKAMGSDNTSSTGNNGSDNTSEQSDFFTDMLDLYQRPNKNFDDNSYINVLTPPKSVPELDQPLEPYFTDIQRPFSSLPPQKEPCINLPTLCSDNLDIYSGDIDYDPLLNVSEQSNQINSDIIPDSNAVEYNMENFTALNDSAYSSKKECSSEKSEKIKNVSDDEEEEDIYIKIVRQGWTVDEAGYLTFGELYLMLGKPSTIKLEYEFEYPETIATIASTNTAITTCSSSSELSSLLSKMFDVAQTYFAEPKQKQLSSKQHVRGSTAKSSKPKSSGLTDKSSKDISPSRTSLNPVPVLNPKVISTKNGIVIPGSTTNSSISAASSSSSSTIVATTVTAKASSSSDKHVFIMPVGTAPRAVKQSNQSTLKDEMKLLPCTRRGCRVRRKPLVVQRPLLPREGMGPLTGPRPMTVVHLVPSVSPITTVIPPCSSPKSSIPAPKKVVNILPSGMSLDMHPIQVPVIKQLQSDPGQSVIMQNSISSSHVIASSSSKDPLHIISNPMPGVSSACESILNTPATSSQELPSMPHIELNASSDLNTLNLNILTGQSSNSVVSTNTSVESSTKDPFASLSPLSLSDTSNFASNVSPTFLDEFGLAPKNSAYDSSSLSSCLNLDIGSKDFASSESSNQQSFRTNSSDIQWLNGESSELSLNSFLNSIESPPKMSSAATSNITSENSNLDPIVRLAPVVDSQVRCLLDECSIDFITKFEDLADVINNSSSSDSKQT